MTIGKIREVIRNKRIFQGFKVDRDLIFGVKLHLDLAIGLVTVLAISVTIVSKAAPGEFSHLSQWSERIDMFVAPIILLWGLPQIVIGLCLRLHHPFQKGLRRVLLTLAASFTARPREGTASTQHPEPPRLAEFLVGWCQVGGTAMRSFRISKKISRTTSAKENPFVVQNCAIGLLR